MKTKDLKKAKGITLIALVVTIIVLLILAGVSIMMLTGDNGILTNASKTSTENAYRGAEERVKLAYTAVKTEIMAQTVSNGTYDPTTPTETGRLAGIVRKDLGTGGDGAWSVDGSEAGVIKILYTDSKIDAGVMGEATLTTLSGGTLPTAVPREEGVVHYQINLLDTQDAKLFVDVATDGASSGGGGGGSSSNFAGLSTADGDSALPSGVTEVAYANVANTNLKNTNKIKAVIKGTGANNSDEVPIPVDAIYKEGTEITGVVIEYKGSEFVWVPVPVAVKTGSELIGTTGPKPMAKVASVSGYASGDNSNPNYEGVLYDFSGSGESVTSQERTSSYGQGTKDNREPDIVYSDTNEYLKDIGFPNDSTAQGAFLNQLKADYKEMVESVAKYGGFYVGRYETSIDGTTVASKKSPDATTIKPMTAQSSSGNRWYGMYDKQKKFSTTGLQSSMIWGSQWDAMLNWMLTGSEKAKVMENNHGNHNNSGTVGCGTYNSNGVYDVINNIYDLEGNVVEGTLWACTTEHRVSRGGYYDFDRTPSTRFGTLPYNALDGYGSRLSLCIK